MSQANQNGDYLHVERIHCNGRNCRACQRLRPWQGKKLSKSRCLLCRRAGSLFYGLNGWAGLFASCDFLGFRVSEAGLPDPPWSERVGN